MTCSKLKLNCTNPSYRVQVYNSLLDCPDWLLFSFISLFLDEFFVFSSRCFSRSFVSSLFYYFIFPRSFISGLFGARSDTAFLLFDDSIETLMCSVLSFIWMSFYIGTCWAREQERIAGKKKWRYLMKKWRKNWQHLIN